MDSEDSNNTIINIARVDLLGKLTTVFDQLAPFDMITAPNVSQKLQVVDSMRSQEKAIAHLTHVKDRMMEQIARKAT